MKGSVINYVEREVQQLTNERDSLEKAQKMLEEIESFFGDFKLDSFDSLRNSSSLKKDSFRKLKDTQIRPTLSKSTSNLCTPVVQSKRSNIVHSSLSDRCNLEPFSSSIAPSRSLSSISATIQNERAKKEKYREELLEQIQDKQRRKEAQHQIDAAFDTEIERKVSRQRLMMYMDQLAEREKGEFVDKNHRKIAKSIQIPSYIPVNDGTKLPNEQFLFGQRSSSNERKDKTLNFLQNKTKESAQSKDIKEILLENDKFEAHILANLNEVRKIMQCDHIEMLEQLLNS